MAKSPTLQCPAYLMIQILLLMIHNCIPRDKHAELLEIFRMECESMCQQLGMLMRRYSESATPGSIFLHDTTMKTSHNLNRWSRDIQICVLLFRTEHNTERTSVNSHFSFILTHLQSRVSLHVSQSYQLNPNHMAPMTHACVWLTCDPQGANNLPRGWMPNSPYQLFRTGEAFQMRSETLTQDPKDVQLLKPLSHLSQTPSNHTVSQLVLEPKLESEPQGRCEPPHPSQLVHTSHRISENVSYDAPKWTPQHTFAVKYLYVERCVHWQSVKKLPFHILHPRSSTRHLVFSSGPVCI